MGTEKVKFSASLFKSAALLFLSGGFFVLSAQAAQNAQKSKELRVGLLSRESEDSLGMCARGRLMALQKLHEESPQLKIEIEEKKFQSASFLKSLNELIQSSDVNFKKPDVLMIPDDETLLGQAEPLVTAQHVPIVFPGSADSQSSFHLSPYIFPMGASVRLLARRSVSYMERSLEVKRLILLREVSSDRDLLWTAQIQSALAQSSGKVRLQEELRLSPGEALQEAIKTISSRHPDIIFASLPAASLVQLVSQLKAASLSTPVFAPYGRFDTNSELARGDEWVGHFVVSDYSPEDPHKRVQVFVDDFKKKHSGELPNREAALCYDSLLFAAKAALARTSKESLREPLLRIHDFEGLMGPRIYSSSLGLMRNVYLLRTQKEGLRLMEASPLKP